MHRKVKYPLPCFLYIHPDLTVLIISHRIINPPEIVHLPSLTDLSMAFAELSDAAVASLVSGCPSLESLEFWFCSGFRDLRIHSASLKRLAFHYLALGSVKEVLAPNLESLNLLGDCRLSDYKPIAAPSVLEVELHFSWEDFLLGDPRPEDDHEIRKGFKELLQNFPKLEKLTLYRRHSIHNRAAVLQDIVDAGKAFWRSEGKKSTFTCLQQKLKKVEIIGFGPNKVGWEFVHPLVEFLLNNALVLEKIAIRIQGNSSPDLMLVAAQDQMLSYERASPSAVVLFETN